MTTKQTLEFGAYTPSAARAFSVFYGCPIVHDGILFHSAIQLFCWFKCRHAIYREAVIHAADSKQAAFFGMPAGMSMLANRHRRKKPFRLRDDWPDKAEGFMRTTLRLKFEQNPTLAGLLRDSGTARLKEVDNAGYWINPVKDNLTGLLLTRLRADIRDTHHER